MTDVPSACSEARHRLRAGPSARRAATANETGQSARRAATANETGVRRRGLLRLIAAAALGASFGANPPAAAQTKETVRIRIFADADDDDGDGASDREGATPERSSDVRWIDATPQKPVLLRSIAGSTIRVIAGTKAFTESSLKSELPSARIGLQGLKPGRTTVDLGTHSIDAMVCEFFASDSEGKRVDLARSHASLSRTLPPILAKEADGSRDLDALAWTVVCPRGIVPSRVQIDSTGPGGQRIDQIEQAAIQPVPCPAAVGDAFECGTTALIRATSDVVDRSHPASVDESIQAEVGGRIVLQVEGDKAASIRVGGPRHTTLGAVGRLKGRLRFHVVRMSRGGDVPVGGNEAGALEVIRQEVRIASALWGQCGIVFGTDSVADVRVVDPPASHLLAVGCDVGLPASGGVVEFEAGGRNVRVVTRAGQSPLDVAREIARQVERQGLRAVVSPNPRVTRAALRTADVLVRGPEDAPAVLAASERPLSTDPTLGVCLGTVDLTDGLEHFTDLDAASGTIEERTLVKAFQDADPKTIDVFVVPSFSRTGRIGESFIDADRSSIRNAVIIDRAGIRAGARSFALAHELGHILLDMPGHPDDYGVDRPWALMDADAADPTIFGPRRLPVSDCERALLQSGPGAPLQLLEPWPLFNDENAKKVR